MKKKVLAVVMSLFTVFTGIFVGAGCKDNSGKNPIISENVLNVQIYKGGHGTSYITALAEKFNQLHANDGYSVNVVQPSTTLQGSTVYSLVYADSAIDVFCASVNATDAIAGSYGQTLLDITDEVVNKPAIKFDGTEETMTIKEKLGDHEYASSIYNGRMYAIPFVNDSASMGVNLKVLNSYGLEIPLTTNDLNNCIEKIMEGASSSNVRPFSCSITGNNYSNIASNAWVSQYIGKKEYETIWSFQRDGENLTSQQIIDMYSSDAFKSMFEKLVSLYDYNVNVNGWRTQTFDEAQNVFVRGNAAFYLVGGWMYNEEYERNSNRLGDVDYIRVPFNSDVAIKFFGSGTKYNLSNEDCEKVLKIIIKGADANKEVSEIKASLTAESFTIDDEDIQEICVRRCFVQDRSSGGFCINAKTTKKELAYEFLRFCASTEAGEITARNTNVTSPYSVETLKESEVKWIKSSCEMINNRYKTYIPNESVGYRKKIGNADLNTIIPTFGEVTITTIVKEENLCTNFDDLTFDILDLSRAIYKTKAEYFVNLLKTNITTRINTGVWKMN